MKYKKINNKIIIEDLSQFNIKHILDCGQIFRYTIDENVAEVISTNKHAKIFTNDKHVEIQTDDIEYFENFFDLNNDYNKIKHELKSDKFLADAINYGYGIRILNQNLFEMIVSFIISANNNIKRIKNSLNLISEKFGTKMNNYFAFPTLHQLKQATIDDYKNFGLGYRAEYMYDTIQKLTQNDLDNFCNLTTEDRIKFLLSLKGVGEKVAHCILLFATHDTSLFPVDTWINKVYNDLTNTNSTNRKAISKELTNKYGNLSGYAQQYFFYYYRENGIKNK